MRGRPKKEELTSKPPTEIQRLISDGDHRHRKTEKEEDEELLSEARKEKTFFKFEKSPKCKLRFIKFIFIC